MSGSGEGAAGPAAPGLRPLPTRLVQAFFSPGELGRALAAQPAWGAALLLGLVLTVAQVALIPAEVWDASMREAALSQGAEMPPGMEAAGTFMRVAAVVGGALGYVLILSLYAGIATLVFAFVMGDEGRYRQYLAVAAHAWLIPAVVGLFLLPLRIIQEDPSFSINLASFLFFMEEGYPLRVARMLDFGIAWAFLVVAQGAHAIDPRRSFASAVTVLMVLFVATALLFGLIPGV